MAVLLTLHPEIIIKAATEKKVTYEDIVEAPPTRKAIQSFIDKINVTLEMEYHLKQFIILPSVFSVERGEITFQHTLCRNRILKNYAKEIDSIYLSIK